MVVPEEVRGVFDDVGIVATKIVAMSNVEVAIVLPHAEHDEVTRNKFEFRVKVERLDVVHLELVEASARGATIVSGKERFLNRGPLGAPVFVLLSLVPCGANDVDEVRKAHGEAAYNARATGAYSSWP